MQPNINWEFLPVNEFSNYTKRWDLLNESTINNLLLNSEFVDALLSQFSKGDEIIAICTSDNADIAMGIFVREKWGAWRTMQPSQAPVGIWLCNEQNLNENLLDSLISSLPGIALSVSLTQLDDGYYSRIVKTNKLEQLHYIDTSWIDIESSFDEYWSGRSKNTKKNLRRQVNKLEQESIRTKLIMIDSEDQADEVVENYGDLESKGWKAESGTAIELNNEQGKFYSRVLKKFSKRKKGMSFQYFFEDALVATDICIHDGNTLFILKTTYDESIKSFSPAMLMHKEIFEYVFNCGFIRRIEFFGKIMEWHKKFTKNSRNLFHLNYYRFPWLRKVKNIL